MPRREQARRRASRADPEVAAPPLPRRPLSDTRAVRGVLERIRRVLEEAGTWSR